jgi:hypothetical protein
MMKLTLSVLLLSLVATVFSSEVSVAQQRSSTVDINGDVERKLQSYSSYGPDCYEVCHGGGSKGGKGGKGYYGGYEYGYGVESYGGYSSVYGDDSYGGYYGGSKGGKGGRGGKGGKGYYGGYEECEMVCDDYKYGGKDTGYGYESNSKYGGPSSSSHNMPEYKPSYPSYPSYGPECYEVCHEGSSKGGKGGKGSKGGGYYSGYEYGYGVESYGNYYDYEVDSWGGYYGGKGGKGSKGGKGGKGSKGGGY